MNGTDERTRSRVEEGHLSAQHRLIASGIRAALLVSGVSALCSLFIGFPQVLSDAHGSFWVSPGSGILLVLCVPAGRALANAILFFQSRQLALAASALSTFLLLLGGVMLFLFQ